MIDKLHPVSLYLEQSESVYMIPLETEIILKTNECCLTALIKLGSYEYILAKHIT